MATIKTYVNFVINGSKTVVENDKQVRDMIIEQMFDGEHQYCGDGEADVEVLFRVFNGTKEIFSFAHNCHSIDSYWNAVNVVAMRCRR